MSQRSWVQIPYGPEIFFQVLLTTTSFSSVLSCEDLLISSSELIYKECEAARIKKYQSVMELPGLKASTVQSAPHDTPR